MSDGSVGDGEFTQVVADHFGLDFNGVENLTVVDTDDGADHFGDNDHVSQVGLDDGGLFVFGASQLGGSQLLDQTHGLGTEASRESSSHSGAAELGKFLVLQFDEVLKVNTLEGEGLEHSVLLSYNELVSANIETRGPVFKQRSTSPSRALPCIVGYIPSTMTDVEKIFSRKSIWSSVRDASGWRNICLT